MLTILSFGAFGSILSQLFLLRKFIKTPKNKRPTYSSFSILLILGIDLFIGTGIVAAYFFTNNTLNTILALHIGASSPLIAKAMLTSPPDL